MNSEEKLIKRAKNGEKEAFGGLYDLHIRPIYRFILIKVGNKADAEDLTHQVFLSAWQNIGGYSFKGLPFTSWLYRIAHNAVVDFYRTTRHHTDIDSVPEEALAERPEFDRQIDDGMRLKFVRAAIQNLEHDQQNVLILKFVNELTNKEIAEAIGKSEGAVRVIQHRALKNLKSQIDETRFN